MFTKKKILIACFVALFGVNEVMAASISTRVRVLETKVAKQDKDMKTLQADYQSQSGMVKNELSKIRALESKLDELIKMQHKKTEPLVDKRYAFP